MKPWQTKTQRTRLHRASSKLPPRASAWPTL
nr:MAG TPA: hypothetical protein [Caudoviricetes sp.]